MHRHLCILLAASGIAALTSAAPALADGDCNCGPPAQAAVPARWADRTPRYLVNQGPVLIGPGLTAPPPTFSDSPSAQDDRYPYVRSYGGWYFVGASYRGYR